MLSPLRALAFLAGILGAAGVALAAAASHLDDTRLIGNASLMCLVHAPSLVAIALLATRNRLAWASGWMLAVGTLLFAGDLLARHAWQHGLFPMAAPSGGMLMIGGWLVLAVGSLLPPPALRP